MQVISSLAEDLLAAQKGLRSMGLVNYFGENCFTAIIWRSVRTVALFSTLVRLCSSVDMVRLCSSVDMVSSAFLLCWTRFFFSVKGTLRDERCQQTITPRSPIQR